MPSHDPHVGRLSVIRKRRDDLVAIAVVLLILGEVYLIVRYWH